MENMVQPERPQMTIYVISNMAPAHFMLDN